MLKRIQKCFAIHRHVLLQFVKIHIDQLIAKFLMEIGASLPEERSHIVIHRSFSAALKIDEIRLTIFHHHVSRLKIPIHERAHPALKQDICQTLKIRLKTVLLKIEPRSLQKAIFEIIEVPIDAAKVELRLRVTYIEVKILSPHYLQPCNGSHSLTQHLFLRFAKHARLPAVGNKIE